MSGPGKRTFSCPHCGMKFPWKDSYVNRKVSCKCGRVFEAFEDPAEETNIGTYDVAEDADRRHAAVAPASTVAAPVARAQGSSPLAAYPVRIRAAAQDESGLDESRPFKNLFLPLVLLGIGATIAVLQATFMPRQGESVAYSLGYDALLLGLMVIIMLAGAAVSVAIMGVEFGSLGRCILKFSATAVFAGAIAMTAAGLDPEPMAIRGKVVALHLMLILYWVCFQLLFDLDVQENLMTVAIITLMQSAMGCVLLSL